MVENFNVDVNYYYDPELHKICLNCNLIKPYIKFFWNICKKHNITFSETYDEDNFAYNRKILENLRADDLKYINTDKVYKVTIGPFIYETDNVCNTYNTGEYTCNTTLFVKWWHDVIANDLIYDIVYNISLHNDRYVCHGFSINSFDDNDFAIYLPGCPYKKNRNDYMCFFNMLGYHKVCPICHLCREHWEYDTDEHKMKYICSVEHKLYQQTVFNLLYNTVKNYEHINKQLDKLQQQIDELSVKDQPEQKSYCITY